MAYYIFHEDIQTPENGIAYFGPFGDDEIFERVNDGVADTFAGSGNVDVIELDDAQAAAIGYINPRSFWMAQLAALDD